LTQSLPQGGRKGRGRRDAVGEGKPHVQWQPKSPHPLSLAIAVLLHAPPAFLDMSVLHRKTENTPFFSIKRIRRCFAAAARRFYWRIKKIAFPALNKALIATKQMRQHL
jgi:hypothetical protein